MALMDNRFNYLQDNTGTLIAYNILLNVSAYIYIYMYSKW